MPQTSNNTRPTSQEELTKQLTDIIKAPIRSEISTADIAVGMMSSTGLSEKVHDIVQLINRHYIAKEAVAAKVERARLEGAAAEWQAIAENTQLHKRRSKYVKWVYLSYDFAKARIGILSSKISALNLDTNPSTESKQ